MKEKRRRKQKNQETSVDNPNITIKEIIENHQAGIPTEREAKMKEERLKKMQDKRTEKKKSKVNLQTEYSNNVENTPTMSATHSLRNSGTSELKMINGKIVFEKVEDLIPEQQIVVIEEKKTKEVNFNVFQTKKPY